MNFVLINPAQDWWHVIETISAVEPTAMPKVTLPPSGRQRAVLNADNSTTITGLYVRSIALLYVPAHHEDSEASIVAHE